MKSSKEILILIGLIVWIFVGATLLYNYGVIERYQVGDSERLILVHNSLTGNERICSRDGCISAVEDKKFREDIFEIERKLGEINSLAREESTKLSLEYAARHPDNAEKLILIDYFMEGLERSLAKLERTD